MREMLVSTRNDESGFGLWRALLLLILLGLIVAVVMKAMSVWLAVGVFVLAVVLLGLIANASDIGRYMKISGM